MPAAAGRTLFCTAEAAGQNRPDDAGEAAHGSASAATDGGRVQKGSDGGANAGAEIRSKCGKGSKRCKGKEIRPALERRTGRPSEEGRNTTDKAGEQKPNGVYASSKDE